MNVVNTCIKSNETNYFVKTIEYDMLSVKALKSKCKEKNIPQSGTKKDLIKRLLDSSIIVPPSKTNYEKGVYDRYHRLRKDASDIYANNMSEQDKKIYQILILQNILRIIQKNLVYIVIRSANHTT